MNNDIDKLRAEMQSAVESIYSQLDINTHGLESATADFESHREAYLAGQQYEADIHRDMRNNYARLQDRYNSSVAVIYELSMLLQNAIRDMRDLMCVESICDMCACQCKEEEPLRSCKCFHWKYYNAAMDVLDSAKNIKCK